MMCVKTLCDGIPNGLLKDRTGVEDIENHLGETRLRWLEHLKRIDKINLVKRVRKEQVPAHMKRETFHYFNPFKFFNSTYIIK